MIGTMGDETGRGGEGKGSEGRRVNMMPLSKLASKVVSSPSPVLACPVCRNAMSTSEPSPNRSKYRLTDYPPAEYLTQPASLFQA